MLEVRVVTPVPPAVRPDLKLPDKQDALPKPRELAKADGKPRSSPEPLQALPPTGNQQPAAPPDDLISSAKRDAGNIDRALRKNQPEREGLLQAPNNSVAARLERNIAAAAVVHGIGTQEITLGDGRRYTKVTTAGGTYCVWGRDARPSAITGTVFDTMTRTTTCPR